jgi:hypothetical protein
MRDIDYLTPLCGDDLFPVGAGNRLLMFISSDSKVVFLFDEWDYYCKLQDLESALNYIVFGLWNEVARIDIPNSMCPPGYQSE